MQGQREGKEWLKPSKAAAFKGWGEDKEQQGKLRRSSGKCRRHLGRLVIISKVQEPGECQERPAVLSLW